MALRETYEEQTQKLLDDLNLCHLAVPVDRVARSLGAQLRFQPLDEELSGMVFIKDEIPTIGINALHHPNRQRFTIAHEIAHLQLHRERISTSIHVDKGFLVPVVPVLNRDKRSAQGTDLIEIQANQFAAALLMPRRLMLPYLKAPLLDIEDEKPLEDLARKFKVSKATLHYRIRSLLLEPQR